MPLILLSQRYDGVVALAFEEVSVADREKEMVHIRLPKPLIRKLDHLAVDMDEYRSNAIERVLVWAVDEIEKRGSAHLSAEPA